MKLKLNVPMKTVYDEVVRLCKEYPDNLYKPAHCSGMPYGGCQYTSGDNSHYPYCGCLIGQAIINVDPEQYYPLVWTDRYYGVMQNSATGILNIPDLSDEDRDYVDKMNLIQADQDNGKRWGQALLAEERNS